MHMKFRLDSSTCTCPASSDTCLVLLKDQPCKVPPIPGPRGTVIFFLPSTLNGTTNVPIEEELLKLSTVSGMKPLFSPEKV